MRPMAILPLGIVLALLAASCQAPPPRAAAVDGSAADAGGEQLALPRVELRFDRAVAAGGQLPLQLLTGAPDRLLLLTQSQALTLSLDGMLLAQTPWPSTALGATAQLMTAAQDSTALALVLRWGHDPQLAAGSYLWLGQAGADVELSQLHPLGPVSATAQARPTAAAGSVQLLVTAPQGPPGAAAQGQRVVSVVRAQAGLLSLGADGGPQPLGLQTSATRLQLALPLDATVGQWVPWGPAHALCVVAPWGTVQLWRTSAAQSEAWTVNAADAPASSTPCRLTAGTDSRLVSWTRRAAPLPWQLDAGPAADADRTALTYERPVGRVVGPQGELSAPAQRLTLHDGAVAVQSVLWDGARYLVLLRTDTRGGRLVLSALDQQGGLLFRDLLLPLVYEPGRTLAATLALLPDGELVLAYTRRRPEDSGLLHLVRFLLR